MPEKFYAILQRSWPVFVVLMICCICNVASGPAFLLWETKGVTPLEVLYLQCEDRLFLAFARVWRHARKCVFLPFRLEWTWLDLPVVIMILNFISSRNEL